jgi:hypothetical protein
MRLCHLSAWQDSTLCFVAAVVNLCGRLQLTAATALPGLLRRIDPRPSYGITDPYVR